MRRNMGTITFIDTEISEKSGKICVIGGIKENGSQFHSGSVSEFVKFLDGSDFICGHNVIHHDMKYIANAVQTAGIDISKCIDTLYLSPLLFPAKPYHALLKDDKLQTDEFNNPLNDSIKARDLFFDEVTAFNKLDNFMKEILYMLLRDKMEFSAFFGYIDYKSEDSGIFSRFKIFGNKTKENNIEKDKDNRKIENIGIINNPSNERKTEKISDGKIEALVKEKFSQEICENANLKGMIANHPIELAYCLALINSRNRYSITPPWVLRNFPKVESVMFQLRSNPCLTGCGYCKEVLDIHKGLKRLFGFDSFRTYAGEPLQEKAVKAAVDNKSLLAVFPTGGGKSLTFQIPALMSGYSTKGLTVIISPLQSLMKDQVDNLEKNGITDAVTINGLLDPIERANSLERVENGSASILYISPESLRSRTIERLILCRNVVRFVIDEAHCFSSWGQDFRVDYLYIGEFIKTIQEKKNLEDVIPVSCFTATAKQKVIEDIRDYFKEKLSLDLEVFSSSATRTNLHYEVFEKDNEEEKYTTIRNLLDEKNCPTIIYVSRTKKAYNLAEKLTKDGFNARPYHGKMDKQEKSENQDAFISGSVQVMVATSAFGMGVDKKDVGMVIHYDISDSLENYIQEAGRAGRDEAITADCYVLFNDEDLSKHFILLNQTKLSIKEIQQIWKAIKDLTKFRSQVSKSALEIARKAGWDDTVVDIETRVKTAVAALENSGYIKRGQNMPKIYADSILSKNAMEAINKINSSSRFSEKEKVTATRIIKNLISNKTRKAASGEEAEARIDYISDNLGIEKEETIHIVNLLREENILAFTKDLAAYIKKRENTNRSINVLKSYQKIEKFLLTVFEREEMTLNLKDLNERAEAFGCEGVNPNKIRTIMNFWAIKGWIKQQRNEHANDHIKVISLFDRENLDNRLSKRNELTVFILEYLNETANKNKKETEPVKEEVMVEFSVFELKEAYDKQLSLIKTETTVDEIEEALLYLSRIDSLSIEGGFMVIYSGMDIERIEQDNKRKYRLEDYEELNRFYENKVQQIHIVGEYAKKMISDYTDALQFVDDYFQLNYTSFIRKYFKGSREDEIRKNITPTKFKQLFGELSPVQLKIINDNTTKYIVVAAGPGSGKTRVLVHKLASLLLMEDVKHEQMLMITFSRAATTEFKKRLIKLIGNVAHYIEIKTFHSYCFDLLGRIGSIEKSEDVIREAVDKIRNNEVEIGRITKTVLVIDEAQDMNSDEFELIKALMEKNEDMRVIAVGDDDQNIYEFRGSSSEYLEKFINIKNAAIHELIDNYRSKGNLVDFSNQFVKKISHRLKKTPIVPIQKDNGEIKIYKYRNFRTFKPPIEEALSESTKPQSEETASTPIKSRQEEATSQPIKAQPEEVASSLIMPLVQNVILKDISGSTCILTTKNDEAVEITGLLLNKGIQAKLIQSNDGFRLNDILEVRFFADQFKTEEKTYIIDEDDWKDATHNLKKTFANSPNLEICNNIIKDFNTLNPKSKYKSDLDIFISESRLEDFFDEKVETIYVSTIHKSKGREFDNVFILLDQFIPSDDKSKRQLYVAMTRAKRNLTIHYNGNYLDFIKADNLQTITDNKRYSPPAQLTVQLNYKDVWLDAFISSQPAISETYTGEKLTVDKDCCRNSKGQIVIKFSKQFINQIESLKQKNYTPEKAIIKFILYWKKEEMENEIRIILPEILFVRNENIVQEENNVSY